MRMTRCVLTQQLWLYAKGHTSAQYKQSKYTAMSVTFEGKVLLHGNNF